MKGLRPYPEYRDSDVAWLGDIPAHWERAHGGAVLQQKKVSNRGMVEGTVLSLSYGRIVIKPPEKLHGLVPESFETYQVVEPGDIIIRPTDLQNDWNTIRVGLAQDRGIITSAYICFRTREPLTAEFAHLLLLGYDLKKVFYGMGSGLRQNLDWSDFKRMPILLPPPDEQQAIVRFVRDLDKNVNRFIRNRRRLIEVLDEHKRAIISRYVCHGLDSDTPLRPSGIDWLGLVPSHWELVRLKHVASVHTGITLGKNYGTNHLEERPYLRVANVQAGRVDLRDIKKVAVPASEVASCELRHGDVLMTEGGDIDKLGRGCVWHGEVEGCLHQNHIFAVRANQRRMLPEFLAALLASRHGRAYFQLTAKQTTNLASTNSSTLKAFPILLPPVEEQRRVTERIAYETRQLDEAIDRATQEIQLVREFRSRSVSDAVTGQFKVQAEATSDRQLESSRTANVHFRRSVFAAEIVHRLHAEPTFGHVKFEKLIFLCEKRCGVDTGSTYYRQAAGPYDNRALRSIDSQIKKQRWYEVRKGDKGYRYAPLEKAGSHSNYFSRYFGDVEAQFDQVINIFRTAKTEQCEIVATLYAAWEDLLKHGTATDDQVIAQVLHHWHPSKQKIAETRWRRALAWMKEKGLEPVKPLPLDEQIDDDAAEQVTAGTVEVELAEGQPDDDE